MPSSRFVALSPVTAAPIRAIVCSGLLAAGCVSTLRALPAQARPGCAIVRFALVLRGYAAPLPGKHAEKQPEKKQLPGGYLGVLLRNVDNDLGGRLLMREKHGALIVTVDRDAPACAAGLRAGDVIVEINGHHVDDVDQLHKLLHDMIAGTPITLRYSRHGEQQTVSLVLADEAQVAQEAWLQHLNETGPTEEGPSQQAAPLPPGASGFLPSSSHPSGSKLFPSFTLGSVYTGAEVDPLSAQLAEFFGVHPGAGLLVRTIDDGSPAAVAGLHAGDVILRVNNETVASRMDWMKQLHTNRGSVVQLSVVRNRHDLTLALLAGKDKDKNKD